MFDSFFGKPSHKGGPMIPERLGSPLQRNNTQAPALTYSKVFRWRLPDGLVEVPKTVEVAGSFNHWQRLPLQRDSALDSWHVTVHHIPGNRTHHYMMFVDGKPIFDKGCDGYAVPHGPEEEAVALQTPRGSRVLMLFAQTK